MMYACASDTPFEEASSAHGSAQKPAWRVGDTADVMFNIDNSPERNGLWSFRKILCISFFFSFPFLNHHFLALRLDPCHPSAGFDGGGKISTKLLSPPMENELCLWKHGRAERWFTCDVRCTAVACHSKDVHGFWYLCSRGWCFHFSVFLCWKDNALSHEVISHLKDGGFHRAVFQWTTPGGLYIKACHYIEITYNI